MMATVLGIDAASAVCGFAVLSGLRAGDLIEAGRLVGSEAKVPVLDHFKKLDAVYGNRANVGPWWCRNEQKVMRRLLSLWLDVAGIIERHEPDLIVVEVAAGRSGSGSKKGARGSLITMGVAMGWMLGRCEAACPGRVAPVSERWSGNKRNHQAKIAMLYPGVYAAADDPGADVADAIGLARLGFERFILAPEGKEEKHHER